MIVTLILILIIFITCLASFWIWFFKKNQKSCSKLYQEAQIELDKANYKKSRELLLKVYAMDSNFEDVKYNLAFSHLKVSEFIEARKLLEEVVKLSPKNYDVLFNLAQAYDFLEMYAESENYYQKAIVEKEQSLPCYLNLGIVMYKQKNYSGALEILERADILFAENVEIRFYIIKCKEALCDIENEHECKVLMDEYAQLVDNYYLSSEFIVSIAEFYAKLGEINSVIKYCQKAISLNSEDVNAYKLLGLAQLSNKDFLKAKYTLSTALYFQPFNDDLHNLLSYVVCKSERDCALEKCREKYMEIIRKFKK